MDKFRDGSIVLIIGCKIGRDDFLNANRKITLTKKLIQLDEEE